MSSRTLSDPQLNVSCPACGASLQHPCLDTRGDVPRTVPTHRARLEVFVSVEGARALAHYSRVLADARFDAALGQSRR